MGAFEEQFSIKYIANEVSVLGRESQTWSQCAPCAEKSGYSLWVLLLRRDLTYLFLRLYAYMIEAFPVEEEGQAYSSRVSP